MANFFSGIISFFAALITAIASFFGGQASPLPENPANQNMTAQVKAKLEEEGYEYLNTSTCEDAGISDLATCFAFSQVGYSVSNGGTPSQSGGYASSKGWCCSFVRWAYYMAGKDLDSCYGGTTTTSPTDGSRVTYGSNHVALVYKDSSGTLYEIDGNWGVSKGYNKTYVKLQEVATADNYFSDSPKYYK